MSFRKSIITAVFKILNVEFFDDGVLALWGFYFCSWLNCSYDRLEAIWSVL